MRKLQKLYDHLRYARKLLNDDLRSQGVDDQIASLMNAVAFAMGRCETAAGMSAARSNPNVRNREFAMGLLCNFLARGTSEDAEKRSTAMDHLFELGAEASLQAPVETPGEFADWLLSQDASV